MLHTQAPLMRTFILACSGVRLSTAQGKPVELIEAIQRRTVDLPSHYLGNGLTSVAQLDNLALEVVGGQVAGGTRGRRGHRRREGALRHHRHLRSVDAVD